MSAWTTTTPHFELHSDATAPWSDEDGQEQCGRWSFVLRDSEGRVLLSVDEEEPGLTASRLELLAVIRGLEALDQPSQVVLFTTSRFVDRGLRYGLENWRRCGWQWERFGEMSPVTHADLWQRLDGALRYHTVDCRLRRTSLAEPDTAPLEAEPMGVVTATAESSPLGSKQRRRRPQTRRWSLGPAAWVQRLAAACGMSAA